MIQLEWKYYALGWFRQSDFWIQFLLKFKEVTDTNQHFCELKQCQGKSDPKIESCEPAFRDGNLTFKLGKALHVSLKFSTDLQNA